MASVPAPTGMPISSIRRTGGVRSAAFRAVAIHEVFALVGHAMLDGDAAAERFHAFELRSEIVSQWSKNQFKPFNGTSRFTSRRRSGSE